MNSSGGSWVRWAPVLNMRARQYRKRHAISSLQYESTWLPALSRRFTPEVDARFAADILRRFGTGQAGGNTHSDAAWLYAQPSAESGALEVESNCVLEESDWEVAVEAAYLCGDAHIAVIEPEPTWWLSEGRHRISAGFRFDVDDGWPEVVSDSSTGDPWGYYSGDFENSNEVARFVLGNTGSWGWYSVAGWYADVKIVSFASDVPGLADCLEMLSAANETDNDA